MMTGHNT